MNYKTYAWAGVVASILYFLSSYSVFNILFTLTLAFFAWAFIDVADKLKNTPLLIGSAATFILYLLGLLFNVFSLFATLPLPIDPVELQSAINVAMINQDFSLLMMVLAPLLIILIVFLIILGIVEILWGVGFLRLKEQFGGLATAAGILEIITGASFILVVLSPLGLLTLLASFILRIVMMFKADKVLE